MRTRRRGRKRRMRVRRRGRMRKREREKKLDLKNPHVQNRSFIGLIWTNIKFAGQRLIENLSNILK
jgi:hypothetical protein